MSQLNFHRIQRGLNWAKEASLSSTFIQHHLGAAVVYRGVLLATGHNSRKTNPIQKHYNYERGYDVEKALNSLHAECMCLNKIKDLDIDFSRVRLFVYRELKDGRKAMSRPCPACMKYIKDLGIKDIYYTTNNGWAYERID